MKYRQHIVEVVAEVVRQKLTKPQAVSAIRRFAQEKIGAGDQARFIEVVENQLLSLHEGNIARYRLRSSEFRNWHQCWR